MQGFVDGDCVRFYDPGLRLPGGEYERMFKAATEKNVFYPLIEFAFHTDGEEETEILQSVIDAGFTPLVAHPERYSYICDEPELVNRWRAMGCLFQVNSYSSNPLVFYIDFDSLELYYYFIFLILLFYFF